MLPVHISSISGQNKTSVSVVHLLSHNWYLKQDSLTFIMCTCQWNIHLIRSCWLICCCTCLFILCSLVTVGIRYSIVVLLHAQYVFVQLILTRSCWYTPCLKKLCKLIFCQNFVKFRLIVKFFGTEIAEKTSFSAVYLFSTSPNLCHCTTVLNADVPNCYITQ